MTDALIVPARWSRRDMLTTGAVVAVAGFQSVSLTSLARAQATHSAPMPQSPAVQAAIWGMPIVNFDSMRQAYFRDAKAEFGDIMYWSKPGTWKLQCLTPNTTVRYVFSFINTHQAGPVVFEIPATGAAALNGTILDAWQVPQTDIGIAGADAGKGGKYLLLPPDYKGDVPAGYIAVPMKTYNSLAGVRVITKSEDSSSVAKALAYLRLVRVYPLSAAASLPQSKFIDMSDKIWDAVARFDESFYVSLARMVGEEPVRSNDAAMMETLPTLGIEKGKTFEPDEPTRAALSAAGKETHAWMVDRLVTFGTPFWPESKWAVVVPPIGPKSGFTWETNGVLDVAARGIAFFSFFAPPKHLGGGQFYLASFFDGQGQPLSGGQTYKLHVPADVPVDQFWSVTVYELSTSTLFRNVARPAIDSLDTKAVKNADGSVDVYIGPKAPKGHETNWIPTGPSDWFPYFRFYGPKKALFDKSWRLPDIVRAG